MAGKPNRATLIERRLLELCPSRVVPPGVLEAMDAEFGVSRQYCKKVAKKLGFTIPRREDKPRSCRVCGQPSRPGSFYCYDCQHVELTCARCGSAFRRKRAHVAGLTA
jgi:uncharacterized C2H2 Zn-finger protein